MYPVIVFQLSIPGHYFVVIYDDIFNKNKQLTDKYHAYSSSIKDENENTCASIKRLS